MGIAVITVLFFQFYRTELFFECTYNQIPSEFLPILDKEFPLAQKQIQLVMIFNELPSIENIDTMNKVYKKFQSQVDVKSLFLKKFKKDIPLDFPHSFLSNKKIFCNSDNNNFNKNYFLLLKDNRLRFIDSTPKAQTLALLLNKNLGKQEKDIIIKKSDLEYKLAKKFQCRDINLYNLLTLRMEPVIFNNPETEIHVYHAGCSSCRLKDIITNINRDAALYKNIVNVFTFQTNLHEIKNLLTENSTYLKAFLDSNDYLEIGFTETNHIPNPIIINYSSITGGNNENI